MEGLKGGVPLQVFVNCSTSDVVATTSLEALALGGYYILVSDEKSDELLFI